MDLIVCVDDRMGMAFHHRRQSRDRAVCEDILLRAGNRPIGMNEYTAMLFEGLGGTITSDISKASYFFLECSSPAVYAEAAEHIILYRWNRHYPADLYFDVSLDHYECIEVTEFPGTSHEKITREVYVHEK